MVLEHISFGHENHVNILNAHFKYIRCDFQKILYLWLNFTSTEANILWTLALFLKIRP